MAVNENPKAPLRRQVRARRAAINPATRQVYAEQARRLAGELPEVRRASCVFVYVSTGPEVGTRHLIADLLDAGKTVAVPVITEAGDGVMFAAPLVSLDELGPGRFGIPAPRDPRRLETPIDAVLAPCVAVTEDGRRLGAGGGYYDRFLADHAAAFTAALAFEAQLVDDVPFHPHDRRVDAIVTERRVIRCGGRGGAGRFIY
mgnify:CR=1 FL=1